jgi:hypothetical protein
MTISDDMVDRVAFAISGSYGCEDGADGFRTCVVDYCSCRNVARIAIAAMREPTEAMIRACDWPDTDWNSGLDDVWRCMIDGALRELHTEAKE